MENMEFAKNFRSIENIEFFQKIKYSLNIKLFFGVCLLIIIKLFFRRKMIYAEVFVWIFDLKKWNFFKKLENWRYSKKQGNEVVQENLK